MNTNKQSLQTKEIVISKIEINHTLPYSRGYDRKHIILCLLKVTCWESNFIVNVYKYRIIRASLAFTSNLPFQITFAGVFGGGD
jgi:hypothetical protein